MFNFLRVIQFYLEISKSFKITDAKNNFLVLSVLLSKILYND